MKLDTMNVPCFLFLFTFSVESFASSVVTSNKRPTLPWGSHFCNKISETLAERISPRILDENQNFLM